MARRGRRPSDWGRKEGLGSDRSARADHHAAGAQNVRQAGPQADADRERRLPSRLPARARPARRSGCERGSHHGGEKRTAAHACRRIKRKTVGFGVPNAVPKWRTRRDSNAGPLPSEGNGSPCYESGSRAPNELREHRRDADCGFRRSRLAFADILVQIAGTNSLCRNFLTMQQFFAGLFLA